MSIRSRVPICLFVNGSRSIRQQLLSCSAGPNLQYDRHRGFGIDALSSVLIPPAVFGGLLVSLWTYKCLMMVIFQNKIIYMPSVPPFSRSESVSDYSRQCRPVQWTEHAIKSTDGTDIKLLKGQSTEAISSGSKEHVVVLYLQGNASSLPPRLPYLSSVLHSVQAAETAQLNGTAYTLVALSYRGFWKSSGRPSQPGIEQDVSAALHWIFNNYPAKTTKVLVWGQSIGAGAASVSLANLLQGDNGSAKLLRVSGLLLETPFTDLKTMLIALYPQRFLPYRYLAPFLRSTWDSKTALATILDTKPKLEILLLQAGNDELVPSDNAPILEGLCKSRGAKVSRVLIHGALHTEVMAKSQGRQAIVRFIASFGAAD